MSDKDFLSFEYRLPSGGMVRQTINRALLPEEMDDKETRKLLRIITEEAAERGRRESHADELLAMVKELSCDRGHAPGCSGERPEYRCKCGWREMKPKAQALINEIEGKK